MRPKIAGLPILEVAENEIVNQSTVHRERRDAYRNLRRLIFTRRITGRKRPAAGLEPGKLGRGGVAMNKILISTLVLAACLAWSSTAAQTLQVPNSFQAGAPARASEVNENFSTVMSGVNGNAVDIAALIARIDSLEGQVTLLEARLAELDDNTVLDLNGRLELNTDDPERPTAIFAGVNVQVINGTGRTDSVNGLGNIVVGYDEERVGGVFLCSDGRYDNQPECLNNEETWSTIHKSGSHNIVVGKENNYSQYGGLVTGLANSINGGFSTVTGGLKNVASGRHSSVSGGTDNVVRGDRASVSGGLRNIAVGIYSSVSGGSDNNALGERSSVSGGLRNSADGIFASVSGGSDSSALAERSSVSGGLRNVANGIYASVTGGRDNLASGDSASITGGAENKAIGFAASVTGGGGDNFENPGKPRGNNAVGDYATVTGGTDNWAFGQSSAVVGGAENRANGPFSAISGGDSNIAEGYQATVSGGLFNTASGIDSTVSGGNANIAAGRRSTVSGGYQVVTGGENDHVP